MAATAWLSRWSHAGVLLAATLIVTWYFTQRRQKSKDIETPQSEEPPQRANETPQVSAPKAAPVVEAAPIQVSFQGKLDAENVCGGDHKEEVFECGLDDGDEEGAAAAPAAPAVSIQDRLSAVIGIQQRIVGNDPAIFHPACVGFSYQGPVSGDASQNPATYSPVLLGNW
jgi:hypothetical protein